MSKPKLHRRDGGGHHLRGRRRGAKSRALIASAHGYMKPKHWRTTSSEHVSIETRLVLVSETPNGA